MATFTFTEVTSGSPKFKKDNDWWHIIEEGDTLDQIGTNRMRMQGHNGSYDIDVTVDTVIKNSTTYPPGSNFTTVFDALNPLFTKANTGTGGTGTSTQTTAYQEATATAGQTVFPFTLPSTKTDFMVFTNGSYTLPSFYTHTTTALTMATGEEAGNKISVHTIK